VPAATDATTSHVTTPGGEDGPLTRQTSMAITPARTHIAAPMRRARSMCSITASTW
jgi:hypothetical protein